MKKTLLALACLCASGALAKDMPNSTTIYTLSDAGLGDAIGSIAWKDSKAGLVVMPHLANLEAGSHGMHIHVNPDCSTALRDGQPTAGLAAGSHFDPDKSGKHLGPEGAGHKGDLPALTVGKDGKAKGKLVAPHLTLADIKGHAIMIHAGGDNYSDDPKPLGGGGARIACGVVQ